MSAPVVTLDAATVEAIAERVAELLAPTVNDSELVDAAEIARRFNVTRDYVYEHATELGAVRLGDGPRARLRFDLERVVEALAPRPFADRPEPARSRPPARRRPATPVELLPVGRKRT